jgi:deoxyribodipyrimidine photo-lyase
LLLTPEDCQASALWASNAAAVLALPTPEQERQSIRVQAFNTGALQDSISDLNGTLLCADWVTQITEVAREANVKHIVTAYTPIGPSADQLATAAPSLTEAGLTLHRVRRPYDTLTWPHANKGFFKVKKQIPKILQGLGLAP